jgi:Chaperone for flagella basal body P-ring formation
MLKRKHFRVAPAIIAATLAMFQLDQQPARAGTFPSSEQDPEHVVARALSLNESNLSSLHILRSPLPQNTRVHVVSVQHSRGLRASLVRLACDDPGACLPFYAIVQGSELELSPQHAAVAAVSHEPMAKPPLRAGDHVAIVEELSGMNLRTAGVCLQSGSIGDRIRVRTQTTHRVLSATIAAPGLVKVEQ